jgi:hypothetical protein
MGVVIRLPQNEQGEVIAAIRLPPAAGPIQSYNLDPLREKEAQGLDAALSAFTALVTSPKVGILPCRAAPGAFLAVLAPVVVPVPRFAAAGAFAATPFVGILPGCAAPGASLAILAPIMVLVSSFPAIRALAASPVVRVLSNRAAPRAFLAVLCPVVALIPGIAALGARAAVPPVITENARCVHTVNLFFVLSTIM